MDVEQEASITSRESAQQSSPNLITTLIISIIAFLFSVGCAYYALFAISFRQGLITSAKKHAQIQSECLKPMPSQYYLPFSFLFPGNKDTNYHSRWADAMIYLFESIYRHNGIINGYLNFSEYVKFSQDCFINAILSALNISINCTQNIIGKKIGGTFFGLPNNFIFFSKLMKEFGNIIRPYKSYPSNISSPVSFIFQKISIYSGIETIKRALINISRPLTVTVLTPTKKCYIRDEKSTNPCPDDFNHTCTVIVNRSSAFLTSTNFSCLDFSEPAVVSIVGYNDNFLYAVKDGTTLKGGFIIKSNFIDGGHSLGYLLNAVTNNQEKELCSSHLNQERKVINIEEESGVFYNESDISNEKVSNNKERPKYIPEECSYHLIPYETAEQMIFNYKNGFGFDAYDIVFTFDSSSYTNSEDSKNSTMIRESTYTYSNYTIHVPFQGFPL